MTAPGYRKALRDRVRANLLGKNAKEAGWLGKYIKNSPLAFLWTLILSVGGFQIFLIALDNHFLPEVKLQDLSAVLASVAMLGITFFVAFAISLCIPAQQLRTLRDEGLIGGGKDASWFLVVTSAVAAILIVMLLIFLPSISSSFEDAIKGKHWDAIKTAVNFAAAHALWPLGILIIAGLIVMFFPSTLLTKECEASRREDSTNKMSTGVREFLVYFSIWLVSSCPVVLAAIVLGRAGSFGAVEGTAVVALWLAITYAVNAAWALGYRNADWRYLGIFVSLVLIALMIMSGGITLIPQTAARLIAVGRISDARVTVTKRACQAYNLSFSSPGASAPAPNFSCQLDSTGDVGSISNINIISRFGSEILLRHADQDFILKKEDLITWSRQTPIEKKDSSGKPKKVQNGVGDPPAQSSPAVSELKTAKPGQSQPASQALSAQKPATGKGN